MPHNKMLQAARRTKPRAPEHERSASCHTYEAEPLCLMT